MHLYQGVGSQRGAQRLISTPGPVTPHTSWARNRVDAEAAKSRTAIIALMHQRVIRPLFLAVLPVALALTACTPPPEGAHFWKQVHREYESRDYIDTLNYLDDLLRTENVFTARAAALKLTILGGMARSALEIEKACADGIHKVAEWDSGPYKTCVGQFRFQARTRTLGLVDALGEFDKATAATDTVSLDFPLPDASSGPSPIIGRTGAGAMPVEKVFKAAVARIVDRHIFLQVCDLIGTADEPAVKEMFESRPVDVSKAAFLVGVAKTLFKTAAVFGERRLDDEVKHAAVLGHARECLKLALEASDEALQAEARALRREIANELRP